MDAIDQSDRLMRLWLVLDRQSESFQCPKSDNLRALCPRLAHRLRVCLADDPEVDKLWSFVRSKDQQRGLGRAIDHATGEVSADGSADHQDEALIALKALLEPFGIMQFYSDDWGAIERHIPPIFHTVGNHNTQKIERNHLTLRTRIKRLTRKTICFSKSIVMPDRVIGLFIHRVAFGLMI